jgi:hypothetical protein
VVADAIRFVCLTADATPPSAVQDLRARLAQGDIVLGWSAVTADTLGSKEGISHYVVYRSQDPGLEALPSDSLASVAGTEYTDAGAAGNPAANHYYVVRAVDYAGLKSEVSATVGEFGRQLSSSK